MADSHDTPSADVPQDLLDQLVAHDGRGAANALLVFIMLKLRGWSADDPDRMPLDELRAQCHLSYDDLKVALDALQAVGAVEWVEERRITYRITTT